MTQPSPLQVSAFKIKNVHHGFFGARGGVSTGLYTSLNTGKGSGDSPEHIIKNRERICAVMGIDLPALLTVYQVHGPVCITARAPWPDDERPEADALVTDTPGLALGILTADCMPVLLHGRKADNTPVIGAAHAGWRGALAGVLQATVKSMITCGADLSSVQAVIGPCIQKRSYEVSEEFYKAFIEQDTENERFFSAGPRKDHPHFDLPGYGATQLAQTGVKNIHIDDTDTYAAENGFFSCRRAAHKKESDYGRQISIIVIKDAA